MRISRGALLLIFVCSIVAETLTWILVAFTARTASNTLAYRIAAGFHGPADSLRSSIFRSVENHPSMVDHLASIIVLFGVALFQWYCLFLFAFLIWRWIENNFHSAWKQNIKC